MTTLVTNTAATAAGNAAATTSGATASATTAAVALAQESDSADGPGARPVAHAPGWLDAVKWDAKGLCTAIAQDASSKRILMVAWMNREALQLTAVTGKAVYWSRSRARLWHKGEESGHIQLVNELRLDCDGDVILLLVDQVGGLACHTGREACFFHKLANNQWVITDPVVKDPELIYK